MAAGLGFKTFLTGDVLTAADTNGYLMQGVLVFATAAARDSAITSPQEGQTCYLKDTDVIQSYSGSAWVTKSAGASTSGLTLITRQSFSNVASTTTTFDSVFSATYGSYYIVFESIYAATSTDDLQFQLRYAGPTTQTAAYYGNTISFVHTSTTITNTQQSNVSQATLSAQVGSSTEPGRGSLFLYGASGASAEPSLASTFADGGTGSTSNVYIQQLTARTYTGFLLKSSSTNITGTVSVYGLAVA